MFPLHYENFSQLFTTPQIFVYLIVAVINGVLLYFCSLKFLLVLQQCGYRGKRYFKWLRNAETPYLSRLMLLSLLGLLFFCALNMCFEPVFTTFFGQEWGDAIASYAGMLSYVLFTVIYINSESHVNAKVPLKKTKRLVRLAITFSILLVAITFGLIVGLNYLAFILGDDVVCLLRLSLICVMPLLSPFILFLAYCINEPLEWVIRKHYIKGATYKLKTTKVIKIGITGSYGKTGVKEILKTILSQKFRVLSTPDSYNTPLGISLSVKKLDNTVDVFIAEMGARSKGDIKELVDIVKPEYGVLTGINSQHLETFGSIENTISTKLELLKGLPEDGIAFINSETKYLEQINEQYNGEKLFSGLNEDANVYATDIKISAQGTTFILNIKGEEPITCSTILLGKNSIINICLASSVAYKMGMTPQEICEGINRLQSIEHRLELVRNNKNIVLIDDSYNSNEDGALAAMEVLDLFQGRKIVVTPGLVELGKEENIANYNFGRILSEHADKVIVVGKHNAVMLIDGLKDAGMEVENIKFSKNLKRGNDVLSEMLEEGDVVLFENDLPDNYN